MGPEDDPKIVKLDLSNNKVRRGQGTPGVTREAVVIPHPKLGKKSTTPLTPEVNRELKRQEFAAFFRTRARRINSLGPTYARRGKESAYANARALFSQLRSYISMSENNKLLRSVSEEKFDQIYRALELAMQDLDNALSSDYYPLPNTPQNKIDTRIREAVEFQNIVKKLQKLDNDTKDLFDEHCKNVTL